MSAIITNNQLCTGDCSRRDKVRERKASENKAVITSPGPSTSCTAQGTLPSALWQPGRGRARGRTGVCARMAALLRLCLELSPW